MKSIGSTLLILGVGTIVLNFVGYEFRIVSWIDMWGETVGWAIRAAMIVVGGLLFFLSSRTEQSSHAPAAEAPRQEPTLEASSPEPAEPAKPVEGGSTDDPMGGMLNR